MPHEFAAAAFVRGAARSTAAEPWKATVRPHTHRGIRFPPAHRRQFLSISSAPLDAAAWRHGEGVSFNRSATKRTMFDYFSLYPVKPLHSHATSSSPEIRKAVPHLGKLAKISLLILVLHKMGLLVPSSNKEKTKAAVKVALLTMALLAGYITSKEDKWPLMLKICDASMKIYKVFTEIVDLLSTFFK